MEITNQYKRKIQIVNKISNLDEIIDKEEIFDKTLEKKDYSKALGRKSIKRILRGKVITWLPQRKHRRS